MNQYDALTITTAGASAPATVQQTTIGGRTIVEAHGVLCLEVFPEHGRLVKMHAAHDRLVSIIDSPESITVLILTPQP
jgi:hypothetical protein